MIIGKTITKKGYVKIMQFAFRKFVLPMDLISKNKDEQAKKKPKQRKQNTHTHKLAMGGLQERVHLFEYGLNLASTLE